jgi:unsaturated rhamnogalacturonyl hydrolase
MVSRIPLAFAVLFGAAQLTNLLCAEAPKIAAFGDWPAETEPASVAKRLAENWIARSFEFEVRETRRTIIYPEVCTWYGSLRVAQLLKDADLQARLVKEFDFFLTPEGQERINRRHHVDDAVFGVVPLELSLASKDSRYLELGQAIADRQWEKTTPDGLTTQARFWIDDMYMITALQVQAYRATHDIKYLDRAANTMAAYLDRLQQPNGLFYHAPDSPFFWGRGNGWIAAGAAELLHDLPAEHPKRAHIVEGARKMLIELRKHQTAEGVWRQLIDKPASWPETSGSAMFTFAMIRGVKDGWLEQEQFAPAARKAWIALVGYLEPNGDIRDVCIGTNKGFSEEYYLDRQRRTGDLHGQAPMLWCAMALLEDRS